MYCCLLFKVNLHDHVSQLLNNNYAQIVSQENLILQENIKGSTSFIHKCIIEIYLWYICFTFIYKNQQIWLFTTYCVLGHVAFFFILIVIHYAFKTNQKCSINSAIISVKVHINYLFNNKSLSLFLTYQKGVLSICNGINVNIFIYSRM